MAATPRECNNPCRAVLLQQLAAVLEGLHLALAIRALQRDVARHVHGPPDDGDDEVGHLGVAVQVEFGSKL
jgi:hypothetical protein